MISNIEVLKLFLVFILDNNLFFKNNYLCFPLRKNLKKQIGHSLNA
jgi:hypothetical protein